MTHGIYIADYNSFMFPVRTLTIIKNMFGTIGFILVIPVFALIVMPCFYIMLLVYVLRFYPKMKKYVRKSSLSDVKEKIEIINEDTGEAVSIKIKAEKDISWIIKPFVSIIHTYYKRLIKSKQYIEKRIEFEEQLIENVKSNQQQYKEVLEKGSGVLTSVEDLLAELEAA